MCISARPNCTKKREEKRREEEKRKEVKQKEKKRKERKRTNKATPFGVKVMRSQVLYWAAQGS